jgi:predicted CopG family antitoxin
MSKNKKVMSIAICPELHADLKKYTSRKNMSVSEYLGDLIEKAVKVDVDEDPIVIGKSSENDVKSVVLKVPVNLIGNRENLQKWMEVQSNGIVNKLAGS